MTDIMESVQPSESIKAHQTTITSTSEHLQPSSVPEAVVALAQVAAKVNDLPGWSLLAPCKVQFLKCEKCSREFCSTINYRRHIRLHRRRLNIDKEFSKNRALLEAYWDKLPMEEAKNIVSLNDMVVEDVTGSSISKALSLFIQSLGLPLLPHAYIRAGAILLDVIEGNPSRFPLSSQELFSILDDASEKTFLHAGSALSMQKYIFSGDAGKVALEMKNLVAFASFMLEQKLVKLWHADKDAEALRCQCLLMEEEEAAKKRQAEIQERKRLKKLRQKEKKVNISTGINKMNSGACKCDVVELMCSSTEASSLVPASGSCLNFSRLSASQVTCGELIRLVEPHLVGNTSLHSHVEDDDRMVDQEMTTKATGCQHIPVAMLTEVDLDDSNLDEVSYAKSSVTSMDELMIWSQKTRPEKGDDAEGNTDPRVQYGYNKSEVLIGSITVTLRKCSEHNVEALPLAQQHFRKLANEVLSPSTSDKMEIELNRPLSLDIADSAIESRGTESNQFLADSFNQIPVEDTRLASGGMDDYGSDKFWNSITDLGSTELSLPTLFSDQIAKAFLSERWKESLMADHVLLTLS